MSVARIFVPYTFTDVMVLVLFMLFAFIWPLKSAAEAMLERPPLNVIVEACRVEGMPPLPPGGYVAPFTDDTLRLVITPFALLIMKELIAAALTVFVLRVLVDMAAAWILFAFVVVVFIVFVVIAPAKTVFVLMVVVLMDAALMAFPT
tara:strand:+ start:253 stop:696 length:444 start_codon:yes stop_codon:yes gene_type:complete